MAIKIPAIFSAPLVEMSEGVGAELVDDLWEDFRYKFRFSVSCNGERVCLQ